MGTSCAPKHLFPSETVETELRVSYLPVMITRLLLSLKKASAWQENIWSIGVPTTNTSLRFAERREYATPGDSEICTSASAGTGHEGVQSRA